MCQHLSIDCEGLDENWPISIQLIRSDIVTTDAWAAWMKWYWAPPWDVETEIMGKNINTCYVTGDNWRRISSINSIKRACNWDTEPKLSPMPSWFRKWRQRMYSVSSISKRFKSRTPHSWILHHATCCWSVIFSTTNQNNTNKIKYLIAWSSIHQQQNESKRYFRSVVWLWRVFAVRCLFGATNLQCHGIFQGKLLGRSFAYWTGAWSLRDLSQWNVLQLHLCNFLKPSCHIDVF